MPELPLTTPSRDDGAKLDARAEVRSKAGDGVGGMKQPTSWLGIETDHRRLLEAAQDGWLHPRSGGFLLGRECFVGEAGRVATRNAIPVRLVLDAEKLPILQGGTVSLQKSPGLAESRAGTTEGWPAPIPLYAVTMIEVSSYEERTRLLALAGEFSNVSLPAAEVEVGNAEVVSESAATEDEPTWDLPENLDAIQGSMTMATWAVPCIDPWIATLRRALSRDAEEILGEVARLAVPWLRFPWRDDSGLPSDDEEVRLWKAAVSSLRSPNTVGKSPGQLADAIAGGACAEGATDTAESWLRRTRRIVAAEETIGPDVSGAGLAIQLVLLRPEPLDFRTWSRELPWLPPGTWWAAAVLSGWRHGYRALNTRFRGEPALQEFLATRALAASCADRGEVQLSPAQRASLECRGENGCYSLSWGGRPVLQKRWHARAKWYTADLDDAGIDKAARGIASKLGWNCFRQRSRFRDVLLPVSGPGKVGVDEHGHLVVSGTVDVDMPPRVQTVDVFDKDEFRRALASEAGVVPDPPTRSVAQDQTVPGFVSSADFVTVEEERELVARIDENEWSKQLKRRVQQYGWRYDYRRREIDASMHLGGLPSWASDLAQRLVDKGLMNELPDQLIVNEYVRNQGILPHIDQPQSFAEHVAMISLLETWSMVFRRRKDKRKVEVPLERRSVAVLSGDARYRWTHEIPARQYERVEGERVKRERRVSLTFRKVNTPDDELFTRAGDATD